MTVQKPHYAQAFARARVFQVMPAHNYADTFNIRLAGSDRRTLDQLLAARGTGGPERVLARLRDLLVAPFGLIPIGRAGMAPFETVEHHEDEVIYGVDDRHADVRIAYRLSEEQGVRTLAATTLVRLHNTLGRVYLLSILPFHFLIVRRQLKRIASAAGRSA
jgi:hypothetical protein